MHTHTYVFFPDISFFFCLEKGSFQPPTCFLLSSCTEKLILIVVISFDVTFPRAISANGWRVSLPEEGKAADDDNYKDCWLFLFLFLKGHLDRFSAFPS